MNEQLISFETARLAKEKGFNFKNCAHYLLVDFSECVIHNINLNNLTKGDLIGYSCGDKTIAAPTQSLFQKWLREKHKIILIIGYQYEDDLTPYSYWIYKEGQSLPINQWVDDLETYEQALELGLQEALKLI